VQKHKSRDEIMEEWMGNYSLTNGGLNGIGNHTVYQNNLVSSYKRGYFSQGLLHGYGQSKYQCNDYVEG